MPVVYIALPCTHALYSAARTGPYDCHSFRHFIWDSKVVSQVCLTSKIRQDQSHAAAYMALHNAYKCGKHNPCPKEPEMKCLKGKQETNCLESPKETYRLCASTSDISAKKWSLDSGEKINQSQGILARAIFKTPERVKQLLRWGGRPGKATFPILTLSLSQASVSLYSLTFIHLQIMQLKIWPKATPHCFTQSPV